MKNWVCFRVVIVFILIGMMVGCANTPLSKTTLVNRIQPPAPPTTTAFVPTTQAASVVGRVEADLRGVADKINADASNIKLITLQPPVAVLADSIISQVGIIRTDANELNRVKAMLDQALNAIDAQKRYSDGLLASLGSQNESITALSKQIELNEATLAKTYDEINALKSKDHALTNVMLSILIVAGVAGIAFAVYSSITGTNSKMSIALGAGSVTAIVISIAIMSAWSQLAWIGLGFLVLASALIIWQVITLIRGLHKKATTAEIANKEIIKNIQVAKISEASANDSTFTDVFGSMADVIQSPSTRKIVQDVKNPTTINNGSNSSVSATIIKP